MKCHFRLRKPLVLSVELRGPLNRQRIDGLWLDPYTLRCFGCVAVRFTATQSLPLLSCYAYRGARDLSPRRSADERWEGLVEQQGMAYAQTVAGAMNLKLDADNPADREKLRRAILDLVAGRKMPKQRAWLKSLVLSTFASYLFTSRSSEGVV
jgi:hypothetical protein